MAAKNGIETLPDSHVLEEAGRLSVTDDKGKEVPLNTLFKTDQSKSLIVFIRHFFCGFCEEYVRELARELGPSTLANASTTLTIIGCGDAACIPEYRKRTSCPFDIYADPKRKIYNKLGMISSLQTSKQKPKYVTKSTVAVVLSSTWSALTNPSHVLKGGPTSQNGGEWLFEGGELKWCHRMANTTGHAEIADLKKVLGIA